MVQRGKAFAAKLDELGSLHVGEETKSYNLFSNLHTSPCIHIQ